jgi:PAB-dependent poly(A)-specific ribonuclease subunit 2
MVWGTELLIARKGNIGGQFTVRGGPAEPGPRAGTKRRPRTMTSAYHPLPPITHQRDLYGQAVTALSFDPVSDILWAGSNTGNVVAYYGTLATRGVCFPVGGNLGVKKVLAGENYVRALGMAGEGVGSWAKGGMNKWFFS